MDIYKIFTKIQNTASRLEKESLLLDNSNNPEFLTILKFLLDPFTVTGLSTKKIKKQVNILPTRTFKDFGELLSYVKENNTGTDEIISNVQNFIKQCNLIDVANFYQSIITKSLKIGCDAKTVNKVYGNQFIPIWEVQQSFSYEKYPLDKNEWFSLSEKLNGVRGTYYEGKILSRQGKEFLGLDHIVRDILKLGKNGYILDGELIRKNINKLPDNENFRIGTGIINAESGDKSLINFVIYDILTETEFKQGESKKSYSQRLNDIHELKNEIQLLELENIDIVSIFYSGRDESKINYYLKKMVDQDKEGIMINRDATYKCKRHNGILKVKQFNTVDLMIVDVEEGAGRLIGTLGAFIVDYKGNRLNVGSGMSDDQRKLFWADKDNLIGRVIEVKFKEESTDKKTGNLSLQFPTFVLLREEGKEVSYS